LPAPLRVLVSIRHQIRGVASRRTVGSRTWAGAVWSTDYRSRGRDRGGPAICFQAIGQVASAAPLRSGIIPPNAIAEDTVAPSWSAVRVRSATPLALRSTSTRLGGSTLRYRHPAATRLRFLCRDVEARIFSPFRPMAPRRFGCGNALTLVDAAAQLTRKWSRSCGERLGRT